MTRAEDVPTLDQQQCDEPNFPVNFFAKSSWTIEDFTNLKEVGKGKDTIIYSATCSRLGNRTVAVKVYDRNKVQNNKMRAIKREISMMLFFGRQKVPHVVELFTAFMDETHIYLAMEYCSGGDLLERLLKDKRALSERRTAVEVAIPLLKVLERIHELRIIHRDIKLENIFIDANGKIKLGDFGLTMSTKQESAISPVGTVEYMAPEVVALPPVDMVSSGRVPASSIKPTTDKVDIWALGVTLYELVTGRLPFEGADKTEVKANITANRLAPFPDFLSSNCKDMIKSMLAFSPDQRPSAATLLNHPYITTHLANTNAVNGKSLKQSGSTKSSATTGIVSVEARAGGAPPSPGPPLGVLGVQNTTSNTTGKRTTANSPKADAIASVSTSDASRTRKPGWLVLGGYSLGKNHDGAAAAGQQSETIGGGGGTINGSSKRRSRSWSSLNPGQSSSSVEDGTTGSRPKSAYKISQAIKQLFTSRKGEASAQENRRVASMPALPGTAMIE